MPLWISRVWISRGSEMKIYWRVWCPRDPYWHAEGVVETVDGSGRDHGSYWGCGQATLEIYRATLALRDRYMVEPPNVNHAFAPEDLRAESILKDARGEGVCCPRCSAKESMVSWPAGTRACPTCGEGELCDSQSIYGLILAELVMSVKAQIALNVCPPRPDGEAGLTSKKEARDD